ncbi:MAG: hypothetical protein AAF587_12320 [Bacteroidota bacterium]
MQTPFTLRSILPWTFLLLFLYPSFSFSQINVLDTLLEIQSITSLPATTDRPVRLGQLPDGTLIYGTLDGQIRSVKNGATQLVFDANDHNLPYLSGMETKGDYIFLCGSVVQPGDTTMIGYVMKGHMPTNTWSVIAETAPYYLGLSFNDHRFSSLIVGLDTQYVYVHSGTRSNSGEVHELSNVPNTVGLRDQAIRGKLFRFPVDSSQTIQLGVDSAGVEQSGFMYAEGLRHVFALAWGTDDQLYGGSNSDRRDVAEAFYQIRQGDHYGFPWWIGGELNPLTDPNYQPSNDQLLPGNANNQGYYDPDPNFPAIPPVSFVQPYKNIGPDADKYRDPITGAVRDASDEDTVVTSFSGHRSPVGLLFDRDSLLPYSFTGQGFMVSYTNGSRLLQDDGHDLLQISFLGGDTISVKKLATGFRNPISILQDQDTLYLLDSGSSNGTGRVMYRITFADTTSADSTSASGQSMQEAGISLYPNPAFDVLMIDIPETQQLSSIRIFDPISARIVMTADTGGPIDIQKLPSQIYLINIQMKDGQLYYGRFLKK